MLICPCSTTGRQDNTRSFLEGLGCCLPQTVDICRWPEFRFQACLKAANLIHALVTIPLLDPVWTQLWVWWTATACGFSAWTCLDKMCQPLLRLTDWETQRIHASLLILRIIQKVSPNRKSKFNVHTYFLEILLWLPRKLWRGHHCPTDGCCRREYEIINKTISPSVLS